MLLVAAGAVAHLVLDVSWASIGAALMILGGTWILGAVVGLCFLVYVGIPLHTLPDSLDSGLFVTWGIVLLLGWVSPIVICRQAYREYRAHRNTNEIVKCDPLSALVKYGISERELRRQQSFRYFVSLLRERNRDERSR